ncbi:hypothetical protein EJB05_47884, partial [Eragrostis curvula]
MAETLLLPLVRGVVGKAADALFQRVTRMWGVDNDRRKLERRLLAVQRVLADAEVKSEADPAIRRWMKELRAVAYRADDVLDHFQYEALRREVQSSWPLSRKVLSHFSRDNPLLFRLKVSRELKNVLDMIDDLVEEMKKFGLVDHEEASQAIYRQTHSGLDDSEQIHGRDDDKAVVVKLLLDQQDQQNVQVLPIIGMGGLGKTTLAKMVYNDSRVQKHFELKMWYCVSENFEPAVLVRSIIELATKKRCDLPDNIELLRGRLEEVISRKSFLLILDDVWNEDQHKWDDDLKPLLCSSISGSGSMIVVTSRSHRVASIMGTLPPHKPACLSEDDSWELFSKKAFSKGVNKQEELVVVGRRIVNKCKGLPLALKAMGGLMSSKQEVQEWEAIADCNVSDTCRGKDEVMSILKLSYRHLSSEMKQCFAFCAVFPKDYEMEKDMLIQLWMANGYIHEEGIMNLEQKAEFVFNELVWRSFLQDVILMKERPRTPHSYMTWKDPKCFYQPYCALQQELNGCRMHDLMHDLAKDVANDCATEEEIIQRKVSINDICHLRISESRELDKLIPLVRGTINLRTLLMPQSWDKHLAKARLMSSRALCYTITKSSIAHSQLMYTSHLRYLDLSKSNFVSLPNSVCMLYNLLSLRLNQCYCMQYLPDGMSSMRKLSHIYLSGCYRLERMPWKLSLLHNLCTLTTFIVDTKDGRGIEEIKDLRQLRSRLELYNLRKVKSGSRANLHEKQSLNELLLCWGRYDSVFEEPTVDEATNQEQVLESLVPHDKLKILEVHGYGGSTISHWMRKPQMFQCLRKLIMKECRRCKDLPIVWLSSSLEHLSLCSMNSLTTLCKNISEDPAADSTTVQIFPKLKAMELLDLPVFERWTENSEVEMNGSVLFPKLEKLTIASCKKLATLPGSPILKYLSVDYEMAEPSSHRSMYMPLSLFASLVSLEIQLPLDVLMPPDGQQSRRETLRNLKLRGDDGFVSIFNGSKLRLGLRDCLTFVEELGIHDCSNIVRWPLEELRCLPRLRSLSIDRCSKLEGKGTSSMEEEILPLPLLENLRIKGCESLLDIPQLPASLENVDIFFCTSLVALPSNLGNLAKLRDLTVWVCGAVKALPDGMDGLTSLERLVIMYCPGIEGFPQDLQQRLPDLKYLWINLCPNLQRRCREGGEYFDLVSSIPKKHIPAASEPEIKKSVKRFLPFCAVSDDYAYGKRQTEENHSSSPECSDGSDELQYWGR